jgi:pyruvate formate lyase activating enzyme
MTLQGTIFDIKKFAIHDGPGIRTTVFLKGCPLACIWCHNPEGLPRSPCLMTFSERCIDCGACRDVCPLGSSALDTPAETASADQCRHCGACAAVCPAEARQLVGRKVSVEDVLAIVEQDICFYETSGGGVTFSGGEPLGQPEFLLALLTACGRRGMHRTVDTAGYTDSATLAAVAAETDLFLFDLKMMDPQRHRRFTGVSNRPILANLEFLARSGARLQVRLPVLPGINDDRRSIDECGRWLARLPGIERVHLLPYHAMHRRKYTQLGYAYRAGHLRQPTAAQVARVAERLTTHGLESRIGG